MNITGGKFKSRKIDTIKNNLLRPTTNKLRQSIFNILIHRFDFCTWNTQSNMLDPFSGSGSVSLEAISRGIRKATLIEKNKFIYKLICDNLKKLKLSESTNVINKDFFDIKDFQEKFKLFFFDPPYYKNYCNLSIEKILDEKIYISNAIIICETEKGYKFLSAYKKFFLIKKVYGNLQISFISLI